MYTRNRNFFYKTHRAGIYDAWYTCKGSWRYYCSYSLYLSWGRYGRAAGKLSFRGAEVTWSRHKSAGDRAKKYSRPREIGVLDYLAAQSGPDRMCFIFGKGLKRVDKCFLRCRFCTIISFVTLCGIIHLHNSCKSYLVCSRERNYISLFSTFTL